MRKKVVKIMIVAGKIFAILFTVLLISMVVLAFNQQKEKSRIDCVNKPTINIKNDKDYENLEITSLCDMQRIEIKVSDEFDINEMMVMIMNISFEIEEFKNVEVIIYNDENCLFSKILNKGEFLLVS